VCRCGVDVDRKHPTMGSLMLLLSLPLFHPLIRGVVSTNDRRWGVSLSFPHSLSLTLSRSLARLLCCSLARLLPRSLSCCVHKRPTIGSLSCSLSFSLPVSHTHSLSRSLALSLSVVLWTTNVRRLVQSICRFHSLSFTLSFSMVSCPQTTNDGFLLSLSFPRAHTRRMTDSFSFPLSLSLWLSFSLALSLSRSLALSLSRSLALSLSRSLALSLSRSLALALSLFVSSH